LDSSAKQGVIDTPTRTKVENEESQQSIGCFGEKSRFKKKKSTKNNDAGLSMKLPPRVPPSLIRFFFFTTHMMTKKSRGSFLHLLLQGEEQEHSLVDFGGTDAPFAFADTHHSF
jgi:hypothetical protein